MARGRALQHLSRPPALSEDVRSLGLLASEFHIVTYMTHSARAAMRAYTPCPTHLSAANIREDDPPLAAGSHLISAPSASMRDLPVELLQQIFALACTDGGYTGCSLSLVSRRFHDVVHTARYHSVALSGIKQIFFFLRCLENARRAASIQVHHLFISTVPDGEEVARIRDGWTLRPDILPCDTVLASAQGPPWSLWPILQGAMDRRLLERIPLLLQAVAADLRTLSIVHSWEFGPFQLPQAFPFLHQLTICGPSPVFPTDVNSGMVLPCFPTLRDLHIVCPNVSVTSWVFASPVLQRLHLSDITPSAARLPCQLRCLLGSSGTSPAAARKL